MLLRLRFTLSAIKRAQPQAERAEHYNARPKLKKKKKSISAITEAVSRSFTLILCIKYPSSATN